MVLSNFRCQRSVIIKDDHARSSVNKMQPAKILKCLTLNSILMKKIVLYCFFLLILASCKKSGTLVDAVIIDGGHTSPDDCGWIVKVDNDYFHPETLDSAYCIDGLQVKISYKEINDDFMCGVGGLLYDVIHITEIQPQ